MRKKRGGYQAKRRIKTKKSRLKIIIYGGLFFCLVIGLAYFFIFSPFLWIEKIEIKGAESIPVLEIENIAQNALSEKLFETIPLKSIILVPVHKIRADILETFPKIASVEINKKSILSLSKDEDNILEIKIEEREPIGVWCQIDKVLITDENENSTSTETAKEPILEERKGQCFYLDKEGIIYKQSPAMDGSLVLIINDSRKQNVWLNQQVASKELINFILFIKEEISETLNLRGLDFNIISIQDLRILTSEGWRIYFNPQKSADKQIEVLKRVLEEEVKEERESLEYIDLRIENRAYYKIK